MARPFNNHGGLTAISRRLVRTSWFLIKWGLLLAILAVAIGVPYLYRQVDDRIRCHVEEMFASHYRNLEVTVRAAELVDGEGIIVRGLSVDRPGATGGRGAMLYFDEVFLACPTDLQHLVSGDVPARSVVIRRPTLRVTRLSDGSWNAAGLLPLPKFSDRPTTVTVENGTVEISDPQHNPSSTLTLRDVNLTLVPDGAPEGNSQTSPAEASATTPGVATCLPELAPAEPVDGMATAADPENPAPRFRTLKATFSGDHLRRVAVEGKIDPHQLSYALDGSIEGLEISPELRDALPSELAAKLGVLGALRGDVTLDFHVSGDSAGGVPPQFDVSGRLTRGRLNDPRLPYPVTDMRAAVSLANDGFQIEHLFARSGQSTIRLSCRRAGYEATSPLSLEAEVRNLEINRALLEIPDLPERFREQWYKYRPFGQIHANVKLGFDGQTWHPEVGVQCLDVSFTHHKFPYRLDHGHGTVELKNDVLQLNLEAYSDRQPIRLAAEVVHPASSPTGWFEVKGDGLPLDRKLFDALSDESRKVVASLNPRGTINFSFRYWREEPEGPPHKHLLIGLNRCGMSYDRFPYPLSNVRGTIEGLDDRWEFRDLEGTNDTARVRCNGYLLPVPLPKELLLTLTAIDLPLEEELRDALQPGMRRMWNDLRPRGTVDLKTVQIRYLTGQKRLGLSFRAEPKGDTTSIEPVRFPYRLEKLRGAMIFSDGHVRLEGLRAENGNVRLAADGLCEFEPDGSWQLSLEGISVDHLRLDRGLIKAMPERMRKAFTAVNPEGPLNLQGRWTLARGGRPEDLLRSTWDLEISFAGLAIHSGIDLEIAHGSLRLSGEFDGQRVHNFGHLALDSVTYRDLQFTQVAGPVWIDDYQALFGTWADRQYLRHQAQVRGADEHQAPQQRLRPLAGKIFEGMVYGNAWVTLGTEPQYGLRVTLTDADLSRIAQEHIAGRQKLQGRVQATLNLRGAGRSLNRLSGEGSIRVQEADVYELPVMISLLKILSIKRPNTNAFGSSDIDYRIAGNHIYLDRIIFNGDAVSLQGNGEIDFGGEVRLNFHPLLGREDRKVVVLRELLGGAGQEFMLIRVSGTLQDPKTEREVFPTVNQALQHLTVGSGGLLQDGTGTTPGTTRRLPRKRY